MTSKDGIIVADPDRKPGAVRRLYNWVISWAESPYGAWALFAIAFIESSFFPIPPDVLLLALALGAPRKAFFFAFVCAVGSVLGGVFGYMIGVLFYDTVGVWIVELYGLEQQMEVVRVKYNENAFWAVLTAGFTPIPYKLFTIASGVFKIPVSTLVVAAVLSRTARFLMVAGVVYMWGDWAKTFIDRYFNVLTIVFMALLFGGFYILKYL